MTIYYLEYGVTIICVFESAESPTGFALVDTSGRVRNTNHIDLSTAREMVARGAWIKFEI